jgi:hypothetical protein
VSSPSSPRGATGPPLARPGRVALAWAIATLLALVALGGAPGVARDEAAVIALSGERVTMAARSAPPLGAALASATRAVGVPAGLPHLRALRLGSAAAGAVLSALLALAAWRLAGTWGALLAPALFWLAPRHLHAGLVATPDLALATLSLAAVLAWRSALRSESAAARLRWLVLAGVLLGGALAARLDAWVLVPALALHAAGDRLLARRATVAGGTGPRPRSGLAALGIVAGLGGAVLLAAWPAVLGLGLDPWQPGRAAGAIPAALTPLLTLPATLLWAYGGGAPHALLRVGRAARSRALGAAASDDLLLLLAAAAALAGAALGPAHAGARGSLHAMPFLALLGARALLRAAEVAWPSRGRSLAAALALALVYPAGRATVAAHPRGASAWNELAGGAPGAASRGLPRQDGGEASAALLGVVNERARQGARIWWATTAPPAVALYGRDGRVRPDLATAAGPHEADLAIVTLDGGSRDAEYRVWAAFRSARPVTGVYLDEVPLAFVYARAGAWR